MELEEVFNDAQVVRPQCSALEAEGNAPLKFTAIPAQPSGRRDAATAPGVFTHTHTHTKHPSPTQ